MKKDSGEKAERNIQYMESIFKKKKKNRMLEK